MAAARKAIPSGIAVPVKKMKKEVVLSGREESLEVPLKLYAIRNSDGKFYRSKGYNYYPGGRYASCWVNTINEAKIYTRPGGARGVVTYFGKAYPTYPVPELLVIETEKILVIDESKRVEKAKEKEAIQKERQELAQAEWRMKDSKRKLDEARKQVMEAERSLEKERDKLESKKNLR